MFFSMLSGLYFHADAPEGAQGSGGAAQPAEPASENQPAAESAPAAPAPVTETTGTGDIPEDTLFEYQTADGRTEYATLADLIAAKEQGGSSAVDPEQLKNLQLFEKAMKENDVRAAQELLGRIAPNAAGSQPAQPAGEQPPTAQTPPGDAEANRIAQLEKQIEELREISVGRLAPIADQIDRVRRTNNITTLLKQQQEKLPMLSKIDAQEAAGLVLNRLNHYEQAAKARGLDLSKISQEQQAAIISRALAEAENHVASIGKSLGLSTDPAPAQETTVAAVDDQAQTPAQIDPAIQFLPGGVMVDTRTNKVVQQTPTGKLEVLPIDRPAPAPAGAVQSETVQTPKGPHTTEDMRTRMRQRIAEMQ